MCRRALLSVGPYRNLIMLLEPSCNTPLPIMLFDQQKLAPSFGYVFDLSWLDVHDSLLSILWKFIKMNGVPGHVVLRLLAKTDIDPYDGIAVCQSEMNLKRLQQDFGLSAKVIRDSFTPALLGNAISPHFRFCRRCLSRGYHGTPYQFQSVMRCPIHADLLETQCRFCGKSSPYHLNAMLLNSPFRCGYCSKRFGTCAPDFAHRLPLKKSARRAITRARILHC